MKTIPECSSLLLGYRNKTIVKIIPVYIVGFVILLITFGWHPEEKRGRGKSDNTIIIDREPSGRDMCEAEQDWFSISK